MSLTNRVSTGTAAKKLGCSRRHVLRLITDGALDGTEVSRPTAKRALWGVTARSVERFLAQRFRAKQGLVGIEIESRACIDARPAKDLD